MRDHKNSIHDMYAKIAAVKYSSSKVVACDVYTQHILSKSCIIKATVALVSKADHITQGAAPS